MTLETVPDLMGVSSRQIPPSPMALLYRLWGLGDLTIKRDADRILRCITDDPFGYRCSIATLCRSCGRRAAKRERLRIQAETLGTLHTRAIVTRTICVQTIHEGHRVLVAARQAQNRSAAWRSTVLLSLGRIEAKRTRDDDGWLVHAHEIALLSPDARARASAPKLRAGWAKLVGSSGCAGSFDLRIINEGTAARSGGTFRPTQLLRQQAQAQRAGRTERRRSSRMGSQHARVALGTEVRDEARATSDRLNATRLPRTTTRGTR